jgi:hypothetical protein
MISDSMQRELAIRRRLAFIRYLYASADQQTQLPEPMSLAGLLGLHDSVELYLVLACDVHSAGKKDMNFLEYFNSIEQKTGVALSQRLALTRMNVARVNLKHHGIWPSRQDLLDFRVVTGLFLKENSQALFSVDFDNVSFSDLVAYQEPREKLAHAEDLLANGELRDALEAVAVGLALGIWRFEMDSEWRERLDRGSAFFSRELFGIDNLELAAFMQKLEKKVLALDYEIKLLKAGIDVRSLDRFRKHTPGVGVAASGAFSTYWQPHVPAPTPEVVRFCLDFAITTCIRLQGLHGGGP